MEERSVAEAYRLYAAAIWRRCSTILHDAAAASDITQEVFIRCLRHHRTLRAGRELLGWLYRVATNLCLNELRDRKVKVGVGIGVTEVEALHDRSYEMELPERMMTAEVLRGLDRRSQELAIYVLVDGMTHAEAAEVSGVSERTVRNCLTRFVKHGRAMMGIALQEEG